MYSYRKESVCGNFSSFECLTLAFYVNSEYFVLKRIFHSNFIFFRADLTRDSTNAGKIQMLLKCSWGVIFDVTVFSLTKGRRTHIENNIMYIKLTTKKKCWRTFSKKLWFDSPRSNFELFEIYLFYNRKKNYYYFFKYYKKGFCCIYNLITVEIGKLTNILVIIDISPKQHNQIIIL